VLEERTGTVVDVPLLLTNVVIVIVEEGRILGTGIEKETENLCADVDMMLEIKCSIY